MRPALFRPERHSAMIWSWTLPNLDGSNYGMKNSLVMPNNTNPFFFWGGWVESPWMNSTPTNIFRPYVLCDSQAYMRRRFCRAWSRWFGRHGNRRHFFENSGRSSHCLVRWTSLPSYRKPMQSGILVFCKLQNLFQGEVFQDHEFQNNKGIGIGIIGMGFWFNFLHLLC